MVREHLTGQRDMADSYPRSFVRRGKCLEMRFLAECSLSDLAALQSLVVSTLHEIEIFMPHDEEYLSRIFQTELSVLGVLAEEKLAVYSIIRYPGMGKDNLGRDLNLAEEDLKKLAHLQAIAVHPHFRGYGLQRKLAAAHLKVLERTGYEHICCTVSPKNPRYSTGKSILGDKRLIPHHLIAILARSTRSITLSPPPPSLRFLIHSGQEVTI